jgi:hypothetical protein
VKAVVPGRKPTDPGGFADDEAPTTPSGGIDQDALAIVRLVDGLKANDRRRALRVLEAWSSCTLDRRVLIEAIARELAKIHAAEV